MELEIYQAFTNAGVSEADAKSVAESINKAIDQRYALHGHSLATRADLAEVGGSIREEMAKLGGSIREEMAKLGGSIREEMARADGSIREDMAKASSSIRQDMATMETHRAEMETRLVRAISDMQRWAITAMFAGIAASAAIAKFIR